MDDRKNKDTKSRLYEKGTEKMRKINEEANRIKVEAEMHAKFKPATAGTEPKQGHRGNVATGQALYELNQEKMQKMAQKRQEKETMNLKLANKTFKNKESDALRILYFKKEFRQKLSMIQGSETEANPKELLLDFNSVAHLMHEMGFLQSKVS